MIILQLYHYWRYGCICIYSAIFHGQLLMIIYNTYLTNTHTYNIFYYNYSNYYAQNKVQLTICSSNSLNFTMTYNINIGKWLACQSMDNTICMFNALANMKYMRKKVFKGHMVAGYACSIDYSPDMKFVCRPQCSFSSLLFFSVILIAI